ncbi:MAG: ABC transporter ATP-binding protein [Proteobacteria bacterium]|nr:ABC transporter ATP-binding protein [Pseudomonadota bacterium]
MAEPTPSPLAVLFLGNRARPAARLLALMIVTALTEGIGLILLVPLVASLDGSALPGALGGLRALLPHSLAALLALFVVLIALRAGLVLARRIAAERFQFDTVDLLRARLWSALLHCEWRELVRLRRSESAATLITDIDRVGSGLSQFLALVSMVVTLAGTGLAALVVSPILAVTIGLAGVLVLAAYAGMRRRAARLGQTWTEANAAVHAGFDQGLASLRVLKSLGREDLAKVEAGRSIDRLRGAQLAFVADHGRGQAALQIGGAVAMAALVWFAAAPLALGASQILPMAAVLARAVPLLGLVQDTWVNWSHNRPALDATLALIARAEASREAMPSGVAPPELHTAIRVEDASLLYAGEDRPALDRVNATIPARGVTAIVGPSGAGKSTLADLIDGLLAPDGGRVWIDDVVLEGPLRIAWRNRVAYVQQDPVMLAASLRDNLRWAAPEADDTRLTAVLAEAAADFALALPQGLDTMLGDGGRTLSGGERQRLMLARALLRDPALLILDEATSALDAESEARIAQAVARLGQRMAVVVIGHRGALLALADRTISLDRGRIAADDGQTGAL